MWTLFDASSVLTCIIEEALVERGMRKVGTHTETQGGGEEEPIILIIIHFDEYQAYINRCTAIQSIPDSREHFKARDLFIYLFKSKKYMLIF